MPRRRYLRTLCQASGYTPSSLVAARDEVLNPYEAIVDLLMGNVIMAFLVLASTHMYGTTRRARRRRAMHRSLSCPSIVELKSERALDACADMLAAFDTRAEHPLAASPPRRLASPTGPRRALQRVQSLQTLAEEDELTSSFHQRCRRPSKEPGSASCIVDTRQCDSAGTLVSATTRRMAASSQLASHHPSAQAATAGVLPSTRAATAGGHPSAQAATVEESPSPVTVTAGQPPPVPLRLLNLVPSPLELLPSPQLACIRLSALLMAILVPIWGSILVPVWSCSVMPVWWRLVRLFGGARPPSPPASPTSSSGSSAIDTQRFLIVLGAPSVGKSSVVRVLQEFAQRDGVALHICDGIPDTPTTLAECARCTCVPLVVWECKWECHDYHYTRGDESSLVDYVDEHIRLLARSLCAHTLLSRGQSSGHKGGESASAMESRFVRVLAARKLVLCNKSDLQPCPMPQVVALDVGVVFLAGSARRGTNMRELWRRVETCAAPRTSVVSLRRFLGSKLAHRHERHERHGRRPSWS